MPHNRESSDHQSMTNVTGRRSGLAASVLRDVVTAPFQESWACDRAGMREQTGQRTCAPDEQRGASLLSDAPRRRMTWLADRSIDCGFLWRRSFVWRFRVFYRTCAVMCDMTFLAPLIIYRTSLRSSAAEDNQRVTWPRRVEKRWRRPWTKSDPRCFMNGGVHRSRTCFAVS